MQSHIMSEPIAANVGLGRWFLIFGVPGLLLGFILASLLPRNTSTEQLASFRLEQFDYNQDGISDVQVSYSNGHMSSVRYDRNFDGRADCEEWFSREMPVRSEADNNFDGKTDYWGTYSNGYLVSARADTDFNGVPDNVETFRNGVLERVEWYVNGQSNLLCTEWFRHGVKRKEVRSVSGPQATQRSITFDPFGAVQNDNHSE